MPTYNRLAEASGLPNDGNAEAGDASLGRAVRIQPSGRRLGRGDRTLLVWEPPRSRVRSDS